jgi:hypothetical protein
MAADDRDRDWRLAPEDDWFADVDVERASTPPAAAPPQRERPVRENAAPRPAPSDPRRTRLLTLAGVVVAVVFVVGGVLLARALGGSDEPETVTPSIPSTPVTPPPPTPTPPADTTTTPATPTPPPSPSPPPANGATPEVPPDGTYRRGDQGDSVLAIQQALIQLGFDPGDADGNFGEATEAAVIEFQQSVDLEADGVVGQATLDALTQALGERG